MSGFIQEAITISVSKFYMNSECSLSTKEIS